MTLNTILTIVATIAFSLAVFLIIRVIRHPKDTVTRYAFDWTYRALLAYRRWFLDGQKRTPPSSFEFWYNCVSDDLNSGSRAKRSQHERKELCNMLLREEYVKYYFQDDKKFDGEAYWEMWNDFRSGLYLTRDYDSTSALKKILPIEISAHPGALSDYMKLVEAGLFDSRTGQPMEGVQKQRIGRALSIIVQRNNLSKSPAKIFAPFLNISEETFREWARTNKNNEQITSDIDKEIKEILK